MSLAQSRFSLTESLLMAWHRSLLLLGTGVVLNACHAATPVANDTTPASAAGVTVLRTAEVQPHDRH